MKLLTLTLCSVFALAATQLVSADEKKEAKPYPLKVCIVSGQPLDAMGGPKVIVHEGQEVKFCCASCQPRFDKNPDKYLKKLEEDS